MSTDTASGPRVCALVGPYLSGKTSLLESMLHEAGIIGRKGSVKAGGMVGDTSAEAKARGMTTELNVATFDYLGDPWTVLDCPGSIELFQDTMNALMVADIAVVVAEPEPEKAVTTAPLLKFLDDHQIPHVVFINKIEHQQASVRATLEALQAISTRPLVLREIPIRDGDQVTGFVDLVSERAYRYQEGKPSDLIQMPDSVEDREHDARTEMLESLADFDDHLMEELLEDVQPSQDEIYENLKRDLEADLIVPVFFGSGENGNGVKRLLKTLRHEGPSVDKTAERLAVDRSGGATLAQVFKTLHAGHAGKQSLVRVWCGEVADGMTFGDERASGVNHLLGDKTEKVKSAGPGDVVALGRMDSVKTGDLLASGGNAPDVDWPMPLKPLYALSLHSDRHGDEVKLTGALSKICEEDPAISYEQSADTGELLLWGQGEVHLLIAAERLKTRFGLAVSTARPQVPYKETIRKSGSHHARHKKQSGGHGEFGDVHIDVKSLPRGSGFSFQSTVTGGAVPKNYIPAVETGVKEYLVRGPLGFPVVDVSVTLTDGQAHSVDSSEMAFKKAGAMAMRELMPDLSPVLLEPIFLVTISLPSDFTSKLQRVISSRRGQILGFGPKEGWPGWDEVQVQLPQAEMHDLIIELRSATLGVGFYDWSFDHLQEFSGKQADQVVAERSAAQ